MHKNKKGWVFTPIKAKPQKLSTLDKQGISEFFQPLIDDFKKQCISDNPDKHYNYIIDIYTKWYQNFFYFCEKFKSEFPDRIVDEFEIKFVRLKCMGENQFEFSYLRHTGQWHLVAENLSLDDCKEMILSSPVFQPMAN